MAVSRNQLVLGLVTVFWLVVLGIPAVAAENTGCLSCHQPHKAGLDDCVFCHAGQPGTERKEIGHYRLIAARFASFREPQNPVLQTGEKRVKELGCRRCHRIGGEGNRLGTDLDLLAKRVTPELREAALENPVLFMPDFRLAPSDRAAIITYLLAAQLKIHPPPTPPKVVHFGAQKNSARLFEKHCGACHQLLSARWGALGSGKIGPNLSGLLSKYYPTPPKKDQIWTPEALERWLKNPRTLSPLALMPPLRVKKEELAELIKDLSHD